MVVRKIWPLAAFLILTSSAAAMEFSLGVDSEAEAGVYSPNYENKTSMIHEFNVSVENTASVGCYYSLGGYFVQNDTRGYQFSRAYPMWAGDTSELELNYIPRNYTGEVKADIDLYFCGKRKNVSEYRFNVTERTVFDTEVESETVEANSTSARISVNAENAELYPLDTPGYWRVAKSEVRNGTAELDYQAPLYQPDSIKYAVIGPDGNLIGKTAVDTTPPEPTLIEKIRSDLWVILAGLLIFSIAANIYLVRERIMPERIREKLAEIELEGRDIRR